MSEGEPSGKLDVTDELIAERQDFVPGQTPSDMPRWMALLVGNIDRLNHWVGQLFCLMILPLMGVMVYEVVMRKLFIAPTLWSYDVSRMVAGAMFMGATGYALMRGVHIRADFLYRNWHHSTQRLVDALLYLVLYFPAMLFFFSASFGYTLKAWLTWELAMDTTFAAPLAPARSAMPLGAFLLILQGISELLKTIHHMPHDTRVRFIGFLPVYIVLIALVFVTVSYPDAMSWVTGSLPSFDISQEMIGAMMIAVMLLAIFVGFPISFTLIFLGFIFGAWGFGTKLVFFLQALQFNSVMLEQTLAAVPLFVFMGILMEKAGLMERLFNSVQMMMSRTRGSLYLAVLFVSTIFAAATGIVGASVTILGIMAAKTMRRSGYDVRLAAGSITAGGTLGILIPPSIMLVVMGPVLEVPVTDLFAAAIVPGIMLASLYAGYAMLRCWLNPELGPALPEEERPETSPIMAWKPCW